MLTADVVCDGGATLKSGSVGTIVHVHPGGEAFVLEFVAPGEDTLGVATVLVSQVRCV